MSDKKKEKKLSESEAKRVVKDYMDKQNRPYNVIMLNDNLHGQVAKTQLEKILDALTEEGFLTRKEFGKQKLWWRNQEGLAVADPESIAEVEKKIKKAQEGYDAASEEVKSLSAEVKMLLSAPTDKEAEEMIKQLTTENAKMEEQLQKAKGSSIIVTPKERETAEAEYDRTRLLWRKRKRMALDVVNQLSEGANKKPKEIMAELSIETDEDVGVSFDGDTTTRMRRGEIV